MRETCFFCEEPTHEYTLVGKRVMCPECLRSLADGIEDANGEVTGLGDNSISDDWDWGDKEYDARRQREKDSRKAGKMP